MTVTARMRQMITAKVPTEILRLLSERRRPLPCLCGMRIEIWSDPPPPAPFPFAPCRKSWPLIANLSAPVCLYRAIQTWLFYTPLSLSL